MIQYGRVTAQPGKHGAGDWKVEYNGSAPRHAEIVFMAGMLFIAEDRYWRGDQRDRIWHFIERAKKDAGNADALTVIADDCQRSIDDPLSFPMLRRNGHDTGIDWLCSVCHERVALRDGMCGKHWLEDYVANNPA